MNLKRANNTLKRHLQLSQLFYAIFGSGTICWSNSLFFKSTFILRVIQATLIIQRIQKYVIIILTSSKYWRDKLHIWIWFGVMLFQVMKMFAMFISGLRVQNLISSVANELVKIDKTILEFSMKRNRKSWLYSKKLYLIDTIGFIFLCVYQMIKYTQKGVSGLVDVVFFVKSVCTLMHSSFCKYVFVTFSLFRNVNEQFRMLKDFSFTQDRTIQTIRILTVQHRWIIRVWDKLMQFYEAYLFFHVLSIVFDMMYFIKKVYMYIEQIESVTNFQVWHVFIGALWSFYEILSICILCTKVAVEGNKSGIIMHDLTTIKTFSYLKSEVSYVFEYMEHGDLSCSPYGIFTINNRLLLSIAFDFILIVLSLFCISKF